MSNHSYFAVWVTTSMHSCFSSKCTYLYILCKLNYNYSHFDDLDRFQESRNTNITRYKSRKMCGEGAGTINLNTNDMSWHPVMGKSFKVKIFAGDS